MNDILFRVGEPTDGTSDYNAAALRYLNRAYQAVWMGGSEFAPEINETWWWLKAHASLTLQPIIDAGTIDVTNDSTSITFSSAPSSSLAGWHIKVDDHADVFKIASHTGGAAGATLDLAYTGETDSAADYEAFKLDYDLAGDILHLIAPMQTYQRRQIELVSQEEFEESWPLDEIKEGTPTKFMMVDENTVRFNAKGQDESDELVRVDYSYLQEPSDLIDDASDTPLVPRQYRRVLADIAVFFLHIDKADSRADTVGLMAQKILRAMAKENRMRWFRQAGNRRLLVSRRHRRQLRTDGEGIILR